MLCPRGCREMIESPKQDIEFPVEIHRDYTDIVDKYKVGYTLYVRTCPECDYCELVQD
jgi:hypothetical protein